MTALSAPAMAPAGSRELSRTDVRERWTLGPEAKYIIAISAFLFVLLRSWELPRPEHASSTASAFERVVRIP